MQIKLRTKEGDLEATLPYEGATHVDVDHPCPNCKTQPMKVQGGMTEIEGHDTYVAKATAACCKKPVGQLRVTMDTLFGLEEDERVQSRCRVY